MIFGILLVIIGLLGLWFRRPLADFKKSIDQEAVGNMGNSRTYRVVVTAVSGAVIMVGLLMIGENVFR